MNKLNKDKVFIVNSEIIEYDIRSANTSICRHYKLIPESKIKYLESLPKNDRVIQFGLIMRDNKGLSKEVENCFTDIVKQFIAINNIENDDIISIKKDAVFIVNKDIYEPQVSDDICFDKKNVYKSYIYLPPYEFYHKRENEFDVKGINDTTALKHSDGILDILGSLIDTASINNCDQTAINKHMKELINLYKNKELPLEAYREFKGDSMYRVYIDGEIVYFDTISEGLLKDTDISYNYRTIILPLFRNICLK